MKRYRLVYRGSRNTFCSFDTQTNRRESLGTGDKAEAQRLVDARNEAVLHVGMNLQIAQVYYQMLWHVGGAQTDVAKLTAEDVDRYDHTISYRRKKTDALVTLTLGSEALKVLDTLPKSGPLFPRLAQLSASERSSWFRYKLKKLKITEVSLHSYRYAWAELTRQAGYPERYAMQALRRSGVGNRAAGPAPPPGA